MLIKFILSLLTTVAVATVTGYGITSIDIILPCIFALCMVVYNFTEKKLASVTKRDIGIATVLSTVFSLSLVLGAHIDAWDDVVSKPGVMDIAYLVGLIPFFAACIILLFKYLDVKKNVTPGGDKSKLLALFTGKGGVYSVGAIILVAYLPYVLTLLPGNMGKDTFESIDMCLGRIPWTNHHPIFFTMLIDAVIKLTAPLGSLALSMSIFTILHMLVVIATESLVVMRCMDKDVRWGIVTLMFFALHPVCPMFALYLSKDVLFSCALVMLVMSLSDIDGGNSAKAFVRLSLFALLTMLLRNNGLLIVAVLAVVLPLAYRNNWKKAIMATLIPIAIFIGFRTVSYSVLDIERESFAESASIPLQQVGYVLANSDTSMIALEDLEFLDRIMPISRVKEVYDLGYTDEYKFDAYFDDGFFNDHSKEFMGVWLRMLPNYFPEYVMSYLGQTLGYWHYGESNTLCTQGVWEDNNVSIERMDVIDRTLGFSLYTLIEKLMLGVRKAPLLNILTSMAMQFMAILLLGGIYIRNRNYGRLVVILPLLVLWVSIMIATPAFCLFRYTYPMFMLWPVTAMEIMGIKNEG